MKFALELKLNIIYSPNDATTMMCVTVCVWMIVVIPTTEIYCRSLVVRHSAVKARRPMLRKNVFKNN